MRQPEEEPAPAYSGWRTENGKTYYYAQDTKSYIVLFNAVGVEIIQLAVNGAQTGDFFVGVLRIVVGLAVLGRCV